MVLSEGAKQFTTSTDEDAGISRVAFRLGTHALLFELQLPKRNDPEFTTFKLGSVTKQRTDAAAYKAWEQACRSKWRALLLSVKAKLVSVAAGVESFEEAFLASLVVNNEGRSQRFGNLAVKAIHESYTQPGGLPQLMAGPTT